jgi:hypothetical protein
MPIKTCLNQSRIGPIQSYKNLTMFPLVSSSHLELEFLLLDEALACGALQVEELDRGGSVPEIRVINQSSKMVLILDGEELVGARQNRIVNTTILVAAKSAIVIPVSCVEQGRWHYASQRFSSRERVMAPSLRAMKSEQVQFSLHTTGEYRSDQRAIWVELFEPPKTSARLPLHVCSERFSASVLCKALKRPLQTFWPYLCNALMMRDSLARI